jgi:hypothetical protein
MRKFLLIISAGNLSPLINFSISIAMHQLTETELVNMGIPVEQSPIISFQGKRFHRGPSFSLKNREIGISYCEREESKGYNFLLVENRTSVTVWKEERVAVVDIKSQAKRQHFIDSCRQELTKRIGPMASLIIDELVDNNKSLADEKLIELIAEQIPDAKVAQEFTEKMKSS